MAIIAQQFPSRCKRLLVVEDELAKAGLGWTGNYWAVALYTALQENRTLVEMPYATNRSRWCWRWPGTMAGCFTEPWTNCSWLATPDNGGSERGSELVVRRKLSQVAGSAHATLEIIYGELLGNASPLAAFRRTALQFLFGRPLPWVRAMGDCVIQRDGLLHGQFVTIFVRDSAEKRKEVKHRFAQPKVAAFLQMAEWLAAGAKGAANPQNPTSVLLQTSSASALEELVNSSGHLHFAFTDNRRSDHDDWGGWTGQAPDLETAVAMVNLYLGSLGGSIAGLASSSWTRFQADVMQRAFRGQYSHCAAERNPNIDRMLADARAAKIPEEPILIHRRNCTGNPDNAFNKPKVNLGYIALAFAPAGQCEPPAGGAAPPMDGAEREIDETLSLYEGRFRIRTRGGSVTT